MTHPLRLPGVPIILAAGPKPLAVSVNQIARVGSFKGHGQGPFELSPAVFAALVRNFNATRNRRVPCDFEHFSETLPASVATSGAPALAWITALDNRGVQGLWATFEWVDPRAVELVRSGQYLYLSPAIVFDSVDRETGARVGPRLTSVALTNHPFLDGMQPLAARADEPMTNPTRLRSPTTAARGICARGGCGATSMSSALGVPLCEGHIKALLSGQPAAAPDPSVSEALAGLRPASAGHAPARASAMSNASAVSIAPGISSGNHGDLALARARAIMAASPETPIGEALTMASRELAALARAAVAPRAASADHSERAAAIASQLVTSNPGLSYEQALLSASRALAGRERAALFGKMPDPQPDDDGAARAPVSIANAGSSATDEYRVEFVAAQLVAMFELSADAAREEARRRIAEGDFSALVPFHQAAAIQRRGEAAAQRAGRPGGQ